MYPVMLNMTECPVLIVGGGMIAARKIVGLLKANAAITVISPTLNSQISLEKICWQQRCYESTDVLGYQLIFACTDDKLLNQKIVRDCQPWQLVNNTSQKAQSTFYNMATVCSDEVLYAISTLGEAPSRAKEAKKELGEWLETKGK